MKVCLDGWVQRVAVNGIQLGAGHLSSSRPLVLLNIFVNGLNEGIECTLVQFVDGTSLFKSVDLLEGRKILERDMCKL